MLSDDHVTDAGSTWNSIISNFLINFKIPKRQVKMDFLVAATEVPSSLISLLYLFP